MSNPADRLAAWILERGMTEPAEVREQIFRDAAVTLAGAEAAALFIQLADDAQATVKTYNQLLLELQQDDGERPQGPSSSEDVP